MQSAKSNAYLHNNNNNLRQKNGQLIAERKSAALMGTIHYASLRAHNFLDQSRKDDLESWFYMLIEMINGF